MKGLDSKIIMSTCEGRPCWVKGRRAIFHRWSDSARPVNPYGKDDPSDERLQKWSVHGIVEYEDGTVEREWPSNIQFADSREYFDGMAWEEMEARRDDLPYDYSQEVAEAATKAEPRTCITCGYDPIAVVNCMESEPFCYLCEKIDCRCKYCNDCDKWEPKGGAV